MSNYESNCGGRRRGCCLIVPVSDSDTVGNAIIVFGLSDGQYAAFQVVSKAASRTTRKHSKTPR